jgi:1-deoxy-D-xylulose-5-phosphate synthase
MVAITAAMPDSTGLLPFERALPRAASIDVGIAEQHAVTSAAGMAMGGLRPVVALYSTFLTRAFDQANLDVGLHGQPVVFCLDRAGITGDDGPSHHGVLDMVPAVEGAGDDDLRPVVVPGAPAAAARRPGDHLGAGRPALAQDCVPPGRAEGEVGSGRRARQVATGTDVCLVGVGKMLAACTEAAAILEAEGISCTVWDPRVVHPLDPALVEDAAGHPAVVCIEDGYRDGGIGMSLRDQVEELTVDRPVGERPAIRVLGVPTTYLAHGKADAILAALNLDAAGVVAEAKRALGR